MAFGKMGARGGFGSLGVLGRAGNSWVLPGAALDANFATGQYFGSTALTTSRASTAYANDASGNWTSFALNVPRITNNGLLVEESRTNSIRNNSMVGAVAGTPGTLPTNWSYLGLPSGLTTNVVSTSIVNGINLVTVNITGTPGASGGLILEFESLTSIAALNGQTWTNSAFVAISNTTNLNSISFSIFEISSGGGGLTNHTGSFTPGTSVASSSFTVTLSNASTAFIAPGFQIGVTSGLAVNFNLTVGWPQAEQGASATSPIVTTNAAVTRAADVVSLTTPPAFGSAFSMFAQGTPQSPASYGLQQQILSLTDGGVNNQLDLDRTLTSGFATVYMQSGVTSEYSQSNALAWTSSGKIAVAATAGDQQAAFGGSLFTAGTGAAMPIGVNQVGIGQWFANARYWNGFVQRIAIWPTTRITNAVLQAITLPVLAAGFVYLTGLDGSYLTGVDGSYLFGLA